MSVRDLLQVHADSLQERICSSLCDQPIQMLPQREPISDALVNHHVTIPRGIEACTHTALIEHCCGDSHRPREAGLHLRKRLHSTKLSFSGVASIASVMTTELATPYCHKGPRVAIGTSPGQDVSVCCLHDCEDVSRAVVCHGGRLVVFYFRIWSIREPPLSEPLLARLRLCQKSVDQSRGVLAPCLGDQVASLQRDGTSRC